MRLKSPLLILLFTTAMSTFVLAQEMSVKTVFNPDVFSPLSRLRDLQIQTLLKLDQKQKNTLFEIQENWGVEFSEFPSDTQGEKKLREILKNYEKAADEALNLEQQRKLHHLTLLTNFPIRTLENFRKVSYRNELALSERQIESIDRLYRQWLIEGLDLLANLENEGNKRYQYISVIKSFNIEWAEKVGKKISSTFSTKQFLRVSQLDFQHNCAVLGVEIFVDDSLRSELSFTKDQRRFVDETIAQLPESFGERFRAVREGYEKCVRMLDEKQLAMFKSKLGKLTERNSRLIPRKK